MEISEPTRNVIQLAATVVALLALVGVNSFALFSSRPAPVSLQVAAVTTSEPICSGGSLEWAIRVDVERVPAVLAVYTSIAEADSKVPVRTAMFDVQHFVYLEPLVAYERDISLSVPELPPGNYLLRRAAVEVGEPLRKEAYEIPFTIKDCK